MTEPGRLERHAIGRDSLRCTQNQRSRRRHCRLPSRPLHLDRPLDHLHGRRGRKPEQIEPCRAAPPTSRPYQITLVIPRPPLVQNDVRPAGKCAARAHRFSPARNLG